MAEIQLNVAANMPRPSIAPASPKKEASSVSKPVARKKTPSEQVKTQERVQEDNIERDIVAVSKDGDTVAVSKEGEIDARTQSKDAIETTEETRTSVDTDDERDVEYIEAPELKPIEAPEIEPNITSFEGISDQRMEQMYVDDQISQYQYDTEMAARKAEREAAREAMEEVQQAAARARSAMERVEEEDIMVENISMEDGNERFSPKIRAEALENLQDPKISEARRAEEEGKLRNYQLVM